MVGAPPPEEQSPQPREINRGPATARGESTVTEFVPPEEDEDAEFEAPEDDGAHSGSASGEEVEDASLEPLVQPAAASSSRAAAAVPAPTFVPLAALGLTASAPRSPSLPRD